MAPHDTRSDSHRGCGSQRPRAAAAPCGPFDRTAVLFASSPFQLCARWPTAPAEPLLPDGPFPAVPTLVLAGEDDLRTPLEGARRIAARIPGATLVAAPETGHSVLSGFPRRCGLRAADDFFAGRAVRPCVARRRTFPPLPPSRARSRRSIPNRRSAASAGAPITAVGLTLADALDQLLSAALFAGFEQKVLQAGASGPATCAPARSGSRCTAWSSCPGCGSAAGSASATGRMAH